MKAAEAAGYIYRRYTATYGAMDEMKLHKLLYFAQREAIVATGKPMFADEFEAWMYGPVMVPVRHLFPSGEFPHADVGEFQSVFDDVFERYAQKSSWSLSSITHGQYSWIKAREGLGRYEHSQRRIPTADIIIDARRVKERRLLLKLIFDDFA